MGMVKLSTIAVDGTKIKANANRHKAKAQTALPQPMSAHTSLWPPRW